MKLISEVYGNNFVFFDFLKMKINFWIKIYLLSYLLNNLYFYNYNIVMKGNFYQLLKEMNKMR